MGRLSHTFWGFYGTVGLLRCIGTFVVGFPRVGKKSDTLDNISLSGGEVVGLIVVEHTAETASLSEKIFVNTDEYRFISVPLEGPSVGGFFDDDIVSDSGNMKGVKVVWKRDLITVSGGNEWFSILVSCESDPSIGNVDVKASLTWSVFGTFAVVDNFDREGSRENVLYEGVLTSALESEYLAVKGSVVMLTPGHAVSSLFWGDLANVHNAENLANIFFVGYVGLLYALWEVSVWVPLAFRA